MEEINRKLQAAEERRLSYEAQKVSQIKEKESHIEELNKKRNELEEQYKESVRQSLDKKMEVFRENRENYIKSIETKARDHVSDCLHYLMQEKLIDSFYHRLRQLKQNSSNLRIVPIVRKTSN